MSSILIVDNNPDNFQYQPENGIYIKSWYNDPNDRALVELAPLLKGNYFWFNGK
jgi:TFIIF-interacting CTD phosphatase-like protein